MQFDRIITGIAGFFGKTRTAIISAFRKVPRPRVKSPGSRGQLKITKKREKIRAMLCSAINSRRVIEFYYHGGYRTVEPFCLGLVRSGKADNESLLCYQTGGFSELREVVDWKLYRASEMEEIEVSNERFTGDRPGYATDAVEMATIYACVTPSKEAVDVIPKPPKLESATRFEAPLGSTVEPLTHNELMRRFRSGHRMPGAGKHPRIPPGHQHSPLPEPPKSKFRRLKQAFDKLSISKKTD